MYLGMIADALKKDFGRIKSERNAIGLYNTSDTVKYGAALLNLNVTLVDEFANASISYAKSLTDRSTLVEDVNTHPSLIIRLLDINESNVTGNFVTMVVVYLFLKGMSYYLLYLKS